MKIQKRNKQKKVETVEATRADEKKQKKIHDVVKEAKLLVDKTTKKVNKAVQSLHQEN